MPAWDGAERVSHSTVVLHAAPGLTPDGDGGGDGEGAPSIVATASYNDVESNTRRRPTNPAPLAVSITTPKIRSGHSEPANRARISTSTVCTNPG
jgi:hypothetical protein